MNHLEKTYKEGLRPRWTEEELKTLLVDIVVGIIQVVPNDLRLGPFYTTILWSVSWRVLTGSDVIIISALTDDVSL